MLTALYSRKRHNEEGFTLIELLVVVIIIGILAAIALPIFIDQQKIAIDASVKSDVRNTVTNITNKQAQQDLATAVAAVSSSKTHIILTTAGGSSEATTASDTLSNLPTLGEAYALCGYNSDSKTLTGSDSAWTFNSASGQFGVAPNCTTTTTTPPSTDPNPTNPPAGGGHRTAVTISNLTTPNNYFYSGAIKSRGGMMAVFGTTSGGWGQSAFNNYAQVDTGTTDAVLSSNGTPAIDGLAAGDSYTGAVTNVKVLDQNGNPVTTNINPNSCEFRAAVVDGGSGNDLYGARLNCDWNGVGDGPVTGTFDSDGYGTIVETENGSVTFNDAQGRLNTIKLGNSFYYANDN